MEYAVAGAVGIGIVTVYVETCEEVLGVRQARRCASFAGGQEGRPVDEVMVDYGVCHRLVHPYSREMSSWRHDKRQREEAMSMWQLCFKV